MAYISSDDPPLSETGRPQALARLPITNISQWVERFSLMAVVICMRFRHKAPELLANQATIVRAECNYEGTQWVTYDRRYRQEALARKDLNWSVPDARLYNEALTGRAKAIRRCQYCLGDDHEQSACPTNPHRSLLGWLPNMWSWPAMPLFSHRQQQQYSFTLYRKHCPERFAADLTRADVGSSSVASIPIYVPSAAAFIFKFNASAAYHQFHTALAPPNAGAHQWPQARQPGFNKITRTGTLSSLLTSVYYYLSYPIADQSLFLYYVYRRRGFLSASKN